MESITFSTNHLSKKMFLSLLYIFQHHTTMTLILKMYMID